MIEGYYVAAFEDFIDLVIVHGFPKALLHLSWAFLFSADEDAWREEDGVDAGIGLSSVNWRDSGNESLLVVEGDGLRFPRSLNI